MVLTYFAFGLMGLAGAIIVCVLFALALLSAFVGLRTLWLEGWDAALRRGAPVIQPEPEIVAAPIPLPETEWVPEAAPEPEPEAELELEAEPQPEPETVLAPERHSVDA